MSALRRRLNPKRLIAGDPPPAVPSPLPPGGGQAVGASDLSERRDELARELAELQWDLGGLAYEMAIRDHFRLDVLVRQAGRLQEVDARLGEVEHLLRLDDTGAAGACPRCGTLYARGALFCSQCAHQLVDVQGVDGAHVPAQPASLTPAAAPGAGAGAGDEPFAFPPRNGATAPAASGPPPAAPDAPYGITQPFDAVLDGDDAGRDSEPRAGGERTVIAGDARAAGDRGALGDDVRPAGDEERSGR
jgi:hypothetical protein